MRQIALTKGKFATVDDKDFEWLSRWKWQYGGRRYAIRNERVKDGFGKVATRVIWMHREIIKPNPNEKVDHINGDTLDNRRENLRVATLQQNNWNSKIPIHNTSGYKGVSETKRNLSKRWEAYITFGNRKHHLGYFYTREEAATAYNDAAKEIFGEYAKINNLTFFEYEYFPDMESVRNRIRNCEGRCTQQVAYSTFHDSLTQVCFGCRKIRTNIRLAERRAI